MIILLFLILHWYLSLFGQTFFLHRYGAHKMFTMNKFWEKFFYIFAWVTQGSSYLNPRAYAILHRMHHAYSDTEKDPHTPHFFREVFTMMMHTKKIYNDVLNKRVVIEEKFDRNFPEYPAIDRIADSWFTRIGFGAAYVAFYAAFATHWWMYLLLPIHFLIGPIHGAIVNWAGHKYGYRNFESGDKSKNTLVLDILMMGELFQNNHHHAGSKPNFAAKWYEFDPTYPIILLLHKLHIIRLAKVKA
ncbi:MAG: fatty acid desaturase [Bacteroidota bacterium]|jgi:stearoyl-CoA desaturase (delta-9 desaturase)|nr:fatty acid desaturase [Bacteroidota bacterium]